MSTLSYLIQAKIDNSVRELDGQVMTPPQQLITDGRNSTYACNVNIGVVDMAGFDQNNYLTEVYSFENQNVLANILYNVPIANGANDLIYADVGSAVRLRKSPSGSFEIVGFSKQMPGKNVRMAVDLEAMSFGVIEDLTYTSRRLTLGELKDYGGGFGYIPLGATALFLGSTFIRVN